MNIINIELTHKEFVHIAAAYAKKIMGKDASMMLGFAAAVCPSEEEMIKMFNGYDEIAKKNEHPILGPVIRTAMLLMLKKNENAEIRITIK